jgi:hypothetical protein
MATGTIDSIFNLALIKGEVEKTEAMLKQNADNIAKMYAELTRLINEDFKKISNFKEIAAGQKTLIDINGKATTAMRDKAKLQEKLTQLLSAEAIETRKATLQMAEARAETDRKAKAELAAEKAMNNYTKTLKKQATSIAELNAKNKELRQIRDNLKLDEDADKIKEVNDAINQNTNLIRLNQDATIQQKMNIGNYAGALKDVKVQLSEAEAALRTMDAEGKQSTDEYKAMITNVSDLKDKLTEISGKMDDFAEKEQTAKQHLKELKNEMIALSAEMKDGGTDDQKAKMAALTEEAAELQDRINDVNNSVKALASDTSTFDAMADAAEILQADLGVLGSAISEAVGENEALKGVMSKMVAVQTTINALQTLSNKLQADSVIMLKLRTAAESNNIVVKKLATAAQWLLNKAQMAMPYIAIAAAIIGIVKLFIDYAESADEAAQKQKLINETQKEAIKSYGETAAQLEFLYKRIKEGNLSLSEQQAALIQINKIVKDSGKEFKDYAEAQQWIIDNKDAYINALAERAFAEKMLQNYIDKHIELQERVRDGATTKWYDYLNAKYTAGAVALQRYNEEVAELSKGLEFLKGNIPDLSQAFNGVDSAAQAVLDKIKGYNKDEEAELQKQYDADVAALEAHYEKQEKEIKDNEEAKKTALNAMVVSSRLYASMDTKIQTEAQEKIIALNQERAKALTNLGKKHGDDERKLKSKSLQETMKTEMARLQVLGNGYSARKKIIEKQAEMELAAITDEKNRALIEEQIQLKKNKAISDLNHEYSQRKLNDEAFFISESAKEFAAGSAERLKKELEALEKQETAAKQAAKRNGDNVNRVVKEYENKRKDIIISSIEAATKAQQQNIDNQLFGLREFDEEYKKLIIKRIELERTAALAAATTDEEKKTINDRYNNLIEETNQNYAASVADNEQKIMDARHKGIQFTADMFEKYGSKSIKDENKRNKAIIESNYQATSQIMTESVKFYKEQLRSADISAEKRAEIEEKLSQVERDIWETDEEYKKALLDAELARLKDVGEKAQEIMNTISEISNMIFDALSEGYARQIEELEALQDKNNEYFDQQQENLDNTIMTDERRTEEQKRLDAERAASEKKTQDEIAAVKLRAAKLDKAQAIMNASINFAQALMLAVVAAMSAGAQSGIAAIGVVPVYTAVLTAIAAGLAGAQLAMVIAQPLPKYARGGENVSGYGLWGEAGAEIAYNKTQGVMFADMPTVTKFDPHTTILNGAGIKQMIADAKTIDEFKAQQAMAAEIDYDRIDDIMKRNRAQVNLDGRGLAVLINSQGGRTGRINRKTSV